MFQFHVSQSVETVDLQKLILVIGKRNRWLDKFGSHLVKLSGTDFFFLQELSEPFVLQQDLGLSKRQIQYHINFQLQIAEAQLDLA